MSNEVTTLSNAQATLKDRITDKLRTDFINLLSPEEIGALYDTAIDEFVNGPRSKRFQFGNGNFPNPEFNVFKCEGTLPYMIMQEITKMASETLKIAIEQGPLKKDWNAEVGKHVNTQLQKMVEEKGAGLMSMMFANYLGDVMSLALSRFQNNGFRAY